MSMLPLGAFSKGRLDLLSEALDGSRDSLPVTNRDRPRACHLLRDLPILSTDRGEGIKDLVAVFHELLKPLTGHLSGRRRKIRLTPESAP